MEHITRKNIREKVAFRYATLDDLDAVMALYERFFSEADWKRFVVYDPRRARDTIRNRMLSPAHFRLVPIVKDRIVGFASWWLDHEFSVEPLGVLMEMYVEPEHRRSAIGRVLLKLMLWSVKDQGGVAFHAPLAGSGMDTVKSMENLFRKEGFEPFGALLRVRL